MSYNEMEYKSTYQILNKLAKGINPETNQPYARDSVLNQPDVIRALFHAAKAYEEIINNQGISSARKRIVRKTEFDFENEDLSKVELSQEPLSISRIVGRINDSINSEGMKKLGYKVIVEWLLKHEYLEEYVSSGKNKKRPTEKGNNCGIFAESRFNAVGQPYDILLYDMKAQQFILDNLKRIIEDDEVVTINEKGKKFYCNTETGEIVGVTDEDVQPAYEEIEVGNFDMDEWMNSIDKKYF